MAFASFASREDAGWKLALHLEEQHVQADVALGLPRGGVVVAAEVARRLKLPLDVIVVRKIGHPRHREFAVGALAEPDVVIFDTAAIASVAPAELQIVIAEERQRLGDYRRKFEQSRPIELKGQRALILDDGLATGATMEAAVASARQRAARFVIVAVPVASDSAAARIERLADRLIVLLVDPGFEAVGRYYRHFEQTTDEQVVTLLNDSRRSAHGG